MIVLHCKTEAESQILNTEVAMARDFTADAIAEHLSVNIILDDTVPGRIIGRDRVREYLAQGIGNLSSVTLDILDIAVRASGNLGVAHSRQRIRWASATDGADMDIIFRQTCCYEQHGEKWLVIYQHVSVPVDLLGEKVAVLDDYR